MRGLEGERGEDGSRRKREWEGERERRGALTCSIHV